MSSHGSVAKAVREQKERHPQWYCPDPKCLWRLSSGRCPKHGEPAAPKVIEPQTNQTPRVRAFLEAVVKLSREHGLSISHEDGHGSFLVIEHDPYNDEWMSEASDDTTEGKKLR